MTKSTIRIVGFEKDLVLCIGEVKGFFAAQNLEISFTQTHNSTEEMLGLLEGRWDVAFDNGDNLVAWNEGQGADGKTHDLIIFMGGSLELNQALYVTADIHEFHGLRGKTLGVDAVVTGYAVVLRYILDCHGLHYGDDYRLEPVGSSQMRLKKLLDRDISGAMLNPRYLETTSSSKLRLLARGKDYAHPYASRVGIARRPSIESQGELLTAFVRAYVTAIEWILNHKNKDTVVELIVERLGCNRQQAEKDLENFVKSAAGSGAAFNSDALATILSLRVKTGLLRPPLPALEKYVDLRFYEKAAAR
jgi:ABC-type nitrate/sulfonate/bicarbonate transport system substrate-binding protein